MPELDWMKNARLIKEHQLDYNWCCFIFLVKRCQFDTFMATWTDGPAVMSFTAELPMRSNIYLFPLNAHESTIISVFVSVNTSYRQISTNISCVWIAPPRYFFKSGMPRQKSVPILIWRDSSKVSEHSIASQPILFGMNHIWNKPFQTTCKEASSILQTGCKMCRRPDLVPARQLQKAVPTSLAFWGFRPSGVEV
jgi:hypothetical protein